MTTQHIENSTKRISRIAVANWAMEKFPDKVKAEGTFHAAVPRCPAYWLLAEGGCKLSLIQGVLRSQFDPALSTLLDVRLDVGGKVLSVSWFPEKPWLPPHISTLKPGDWMYRLGWQP